MMAARKSLHEYRGAVFDLDGTLVDSMHIWDRLCRDWLTSKGKSPGPELEKDLATMSLTRGAGYVRRRYGIDLSPENIVSQWEAMALDAYKSSVPLKQEIADLARELHRAGLRLAVVTSCFPAACEAALARHGLAPLFSVILYTDEALRGKGFPDIWLAAAERLGLDPSDCVVFEDAYHALLGAHAAGMAFAAVYDDSCREWELMKAEADWIVADTETSGHFTPHTFL